MNDFEFNQPYQQEILVIDDTPSNLRFLTDILRNHGYRVRPASSGRLALRSVAVEVPDLILLDIKMPDMDGYEVCRRLKADGLTSKVPVIFISALMDTAEKVEGFKAGCVDYITKPFETDELLARVRTQLRIQELTERLEQKVQERTKDLYGAIRQLRQEIVQRKEAEALLRRKNLAYRALCKCNQALVRAGDEAVLLQQVCDIIHVDCGFNLVWIGFMEQDKARTVRTVAQAGNDSGYLDAMTVSWAKTELGFGPTGRAILEKRMVVNNDIVNDADLGPWRDEAVERGYASCAVLPLMKGSHNPIGALTVFSSEPDAFAGEEIELLREIVNDLAYGIGALQSKAGNP